MKRLTRRAAAVIVGLVLGWYVAGIIPVGQSPVVPAPGANYALASSADDAHHDPHDDHGHAADDSLNIDDTPGAQHGAHDEHGVDAVHDAALAAAGQLVPRPEDITWYRSVLCVAGGLFVAAVVLGIPALKMRGPEPTDPPDPADTHSH